MKNMMIAAAVLAGLMGTTTLAQTTEPAADATTTAPEAPADVQPMHFGRGMGGPLAGATFADLDSDGSGGVTLEELQARQAARFADADANADGALSAEEVQSALLRQMAEQMIARHDANGDGLLQPEEMQPNEGLGMERMFDLADSDNDGSVSEAEFDAMKPEMEKMRGEGRGRGGHHGDGHGRGHGRGFFGFGGN